MQSVKDSVEEFVKQKEKELNDIQQRENQERLKKYREQLKPVKKYALYTGFTIINKEPLFELVRNTDFYKSFKKPTEFRYYFATIHRSSLFKGYVSPDEIIYNKSSDIIIKYYNEQKNPEKGIIDGYYISNEEKFIGITILVHDKRYYTTIYDRITKK
jgi:hypothetical protein